MSSLIRAFADCITGSSSNTTAAQFNDDKQGAPSRESHTAQQIADDVVQAILTAEKGGKHLQKTLDNIVGEYGWTEKIAQWTLAKLEQALKEACKLGSVLKEAYDKAFEAAEGIEGFIREHPVFCTVIALGVLVIIAPWVIEALGFGELSPIEGMSI